MRKVKPKKHEFEICEIFLFLILGIKMKNWKTFKSSVKNKSLNFIEKMKIIQPE